MPDDVRTTFVVGGERAERHVRLRGAGQARRRARPGVRVSAAVVLTAVALVSTVIGVSGPDPGTPAPTAISLSVPTTIPDDLDLGVDTPRGADYRIEAADRLPVDVCPGAGIPGLDSATDQRSLLITGPEYGEGRALLVFADANAAVAFVTGLQVAADSCADGVPRPEGGTREIVREPLPGAWATGLSLLLADVPDPGGDPQPVIGSLLLAVRTGSAVALQYRAGEYFLFDRPFRVDPDVLGTARRPLDALAPQLCRWTVAGC